MAGFIIRPKDTNKVTGDSARIKAEGALPAQDGIDREYIPATGFDADQDGKSGAEHRRDNVRREAEPTAPLPGGSWRGAPTRSVPSGFGKGTRAGSSGRGR